jgi:type I restriction enzyme M protein
MTNEAIVRKIWSLCHILRGDGVSYHQYVSELTYLLFLKIAEENGSEDLLSDGYRWKDLVGAPDAGLLAFYQEMLTHLGSHAKSDTVRDIYMFPTTVFSHGENLRAVISGIAQIDWTSVSADGFGLIYEGLLQHSADVRSGAGQYFTPRALVDALVRVSRPSLGELIQDPATGSGGFLVAADRFIRGFTSPAGYKKNKPRYQGVEIEKNTRRICLMNTFLNGLDAEVVLGDALTDDAAFLDPADLILANPPFGSKSGTRRKFRADLPFPTVNKQLAFLQHIYLNLKDGGRAAVVLPDNVLFEDGLAVQVRRDLMDRCDLHTILKLPAGIFASAGVKTNVLFFVKRPGAKSQATRTVWVYDMRSQVDAFSKTRALTQEHFDDFVAAYGADPLGQSSRTDHGETGRFRAFTREKIAELGESLDIGWLREDEADGEGGLDELSAVAAAILGHLQAAMEGIDALKDEFAVLDPDEPAAKMRGQ